MIERNLISVDMHQAMNNRLKIFRFDWMNLAISVLYDFHRSIGHCASRHAILELEDSWVRNSRKGLGRDVVDVEELI